MDTFSRKWLLIITLLTIAVIITTGLTVIVTASCEGHILCRIEDVETNPSYWAVFLCSLILLLVLIVTMIHLMRLKKKWDEQQARHERKFPLVDFRPVKVNSEDFQPHQINIIANRLSRQYSDEQF
ncbi:hypothetical protein HDE_11559 [Halotydeus destructor]|nr:hypothetical protein HDE_11559 [Halotydeus destructor]